MADHLATFPLSSHPLNDSYDLTTAPTGLRSSPKQRYTAPTQSQQRKLYKAKPNDQPGHPTPVSGSTGPNSRRNANAIGDSGNDLSNGGYQAPVLPDDSTGIRSSRSSLDTMYYERLEEGLLQQSRDARDGLWSQSKVTNQALRAQATGHSQRLHEDKGKPQRGPPTRARPQRWPFMDEPEESYVQAQGATTEMGRSTNRGLAGSATRKRRPSSAKRWWKSLWGGTLSNESQPPHGSQYGSRRSVNEGDAEMDSSITEPQNIRQGERSVRGAAADYYDENQSFATQHYEHAVPGQAQDLSRPDLAPVELQPDNSSNPAQSSESQRHTGDANCWCHHTRRTCKHRGHAEGLHKKLYA
ncbi:hypothetical protein LTR56_021327 [Elasticomyces elasticus]|nr:hypothetical protein LTR56_021327 [Elasticomyces elasticus]KAK3631668.1 hypothetical protein LTR22_020958 [Elasticomyces elasticus]KAK4909573.1 hypothetical protein LTR49_021690 [Elasticomyces elasticus]KAK5737846.1 hypothetical protein LTS12_025784 [Elasticomyces elasticus]